MLEYFLFFYFLQIAIFLVILLILFFLGFFNESPAESHKIEPKTTLDFLIEQIQIAGQNDENKEILDSVMREFYANFYVVSPQSVHFDKWLKLLQDITMLDYMSVEQASEFRDELTRKNPSAKKQIEQSIGTSLKYREKKR